MAFLLRRVPVMSIARLSCVKVNSQATFSKSLELAAVYSTSSGFATPKKVCAHAPYLENPIAYLPVRCYAKKSKDKVKHLKKKGGKSSKPRVELSEAELSEVIDFNKFKSELETALEQLKTDLNHQLSLRTNVSTFDSLTVETADGKFPLIKIGRVVMKNPSLVVIDMNVNHQYIGDVKKAIENSGMNINPQQDKNTLFVPIPKITREHRVKLAENGKTLCDRTKDKLRTIQNNYVRVIKREQSLHSEDLIHNLLETVQSVAHNYMTQAEELMLLKKEELLA